MKIVPGGPTVYGTATGANGDVHAIAWSVPEPAAIGLLSLVLPMARRRANSKGVGRLT